MKIEVHRMYVDLNCLPTNLAVWFTTLLDLETVVTFCTTVAQELLKIN